MEMKCGVHTGAVSQSNKERMFRVLARRWLGFLLNMSRGRLGTQVANQTESVQMRYGVQYFVHPYSVPVFDETAACGKAHSKPQTAERVDDWKKPREAGGRAKKNPTFELSSGGTKGSGDAQSPRYEKGKKNKKEMRLQSGKRAQFGAAADINCVRSSALHVY
jgi:hypothetical protein